MAERVCHELVGRSPGGGACCVDAARGARWCACWQDVYDRDQAAPDAVRLPAAGLELWITASWGALTEPTVRRRMCGDCAYRPGSPERTGDDRYRGDETELDRIAAQSRFWCHQGLRRRLGRTHPAGFSVPSGPGDYAPLVVAGVPYRADGRPGELCAGWAARRRALSARGLR